MTKTILFGISITTVLAISLIAGAVAFHQPYQVGATSTVTQGPTLTNIVITTADPSIPIPAHTKALTGFAWGVSGGVQATHFGVATHHGVKDSTQRPNQWHLHNLQLGAGAGDAEACIIDIIDNPFGKINVKRNVMDITLPTSTIDGVITPGLAPFDIIPEPGCPFTKVGGVTTPLKLGADLS